jgi:hypothetical protein
VTDTLSTRPDPKNPQRVKPEGPLKLRDDEADRKGLSFYVKSATVGPDDGMGKPYFLITDRGGVGAREAGTRRYVVEPLEGATGLGHVDVLDFATWHDATEAAYEAAKALHEYVRATSEAQRHRQIARQALGLDRPEPAEAAAT